MNIAEIAIDLAEQGHVPDFLIRLAIRRLLRNRLRDEHVDDPEQAERRYAELIRELNQSPIAIETEAANEQHYEVPAEFYRQVLGKHLKYSCAWWDEDCASLDEAEARMLALTCRRAGLRDGQQILELGCGWGSLTLWMASHYPGSSIVAVSNSASQRKYIEGEARRRGLKNVEVLTRDVNFLELDREFDRAVSVEMFEHVRNYRHLLSRIAGWLKPEGRLFVHIFCHRYLLYPFETEGEGNWMGRHFFTGGLMPAADTLLWFADELQIRNRWMVDGRHYARTAGAWLELLDRNPDRARQALRESCPEPKQQLQRWRMFFMACEELFGYRGGSEWMVGHYLFEKAATSHRPDPPGTA